jgi:Uma2 family endonuclease
MASSSSMELDTYLRGVEEMRRRELVWGVVREPPAPRYGHQSVVTTVTCLLDHHVRARSLGRVCVSPADVILDAARALVVQPDVFFISTERMHIVRDQVWGAPDLVVEVASPASARYDATIKLGWYRAYGVRECWLLDMTREDITVVRGESGATRSFAANERVASTVLPRLAVAAGEFFA